MFDFNGKFHAFEQLFLFVGFITSLIMNSEFSLLFAALNQSGKIAILIGNCVIYPYEC